MRSNMQSHFRSQYFVARYITDYLLPRTKILSPHRSPHSLPRVFYVLFLLTQSYAVTQCCIMSQYGRHVLLLLFLSIFGLRKRLLHVLYNWCPQDGKLLILITRCGGETGLSLLFPIYIIFFVELNPLLDVTLAISSIYNPSCRTVCQKFRFLSCLAYKWFCQETWKSRKPITTRTAWISFSLPTSVETFDERNL